MPEAPQPPLPPSALQAVGRAVQDLAAVRLGRGFIPLTLLFLLGVGQMLTGSPGFPVAVGAPVSAAAMLAYGLRVVQRAFGRAARPWMVLAVLGSLIPPLFGVYVMGWRGLRVVAQASGPGSILSGLVMVALGVWVLRSWVQLLELHRLADAMAVGFMDGDEESK